jgi:predicted dinucleotide-binding enzyme
MTLHTLLLLVISSPCAVAETIAIIGTGNVGSALGPEFAAQGHAIVYGSRDPAADKVTELVARTSGEATAVTPDKAVIEADIVILAVPGLLIEEITLGLGDLAGKIIIDPTNPLQFSDSGASIDATVSNTEIIQAAAPDAFAVKAFNTLNWQIMVDPGLGGGPVSVPLAGDDDAAKTAVAALIESLGLEPIDMGDSSNARWLEGMAVLLVNNNFMSPRPAFNFHLRREDR